MNNLIYFIVGPTSIGKSEFAKKLARKINGQIINADSMQVYKELCIITARPTKNETDEIKHHLYGHINCSERYNVAKWCHQATNKINLCLKNKIAPILVGGTGLYIEKLINGLIDIPSIPENIKVETEDIFIKEGINEFYNRIKKIDPNILNTIESNDSNRLKRIWDVYSFTGKNMTYWLQNKSNFFLSNNIKYNLLLFLPNRIKNYNRVNKRFVKMIDSGAINEVNKLLKLNLNKSLPAMKAHGVPEISLFIENKISIDTCIKKGQQVTRNYVKRQHTWWKSSNLKIFKKFNQFPDEIDIKLMNFH